MWVFVCVSIACFYTWVCLGLSVCVGPLYSSVCVCVCVCLGVSTPIHRPSGSLLVLLELDVDVCVCLLLVSTHGCVWVCLWAWGPSFQCVGVCVCGVCLVFPLLSIGLQVLSSPELVLLFSPRCTWCCTCLDMPPFSGRLGFCFIVPT